MQKGKGLYLLKGVLAIGLVLTFSGARSGAEKPELGWMNLEEAAGKLQKE